MLAMAPLPARDTITRMRVMFGIAALATSACWTNPPPREPVQNQTVVQASSESISPFPHHSVWVGTYRCNQGLSAVRLTIDASDSGSATARYDFGPLEENPSVPVGAFELTGDLKAKSAGFTGELEATRWIVQPEGYFMVGLSIESTPNGRRLRGTIHHETCSDFQVRRVS
jgi:hypothetical protein